MQTDEEIGKVAAAVPVIICILSFRQLSVFVITHILTSAAQVQLSQTNR